MEQALTVTAFREKLQSEGISRFYSGALHFIFTAGTSAAVIVYCFLHLHEVRGREWWIVPATFLYANFTEYFAHRGPMHHSWQALRAVFVGHAVNHHQYFTHEAMALEGPRDLAVILFPPAMLVVLFGVFGVPVAFLLAGMISKNAGYLFFMTAMAYYLNYEMFHLAYHLPEDSLAGRLPLIDRLRRNHTQHHDLRLMSKQCFNITYPIGDWLFGTSAAPQKERH